MPDDNCVFCGCDIKESKTSYFFDGGDYRALPLVISNVPCRKCAGCENVFVDYEIHERAIGLMKQERLQGAEFIRVQRISFK